MGIKINESFYDGCFNGYRSRLDDLILVHEILEEIPLKLGVKPVMPPFILPYYNGVVRIREIAPLSFWREAILQSIPFPSGRFILWIWYLRSHLTASGS